MSRFYITTAIPYVNAAPHIGFGLELIQTDFFARYWREKLGTSQVRALTGTDENSLKNVRAAEDADQEVALYVAEKAQEFKNLQSTLNLSFDDFIRTREERHLSGAQKLWSACKPEDIYQKKYQGLYCVGCEQFYTTKECPDGICPDHKTKLDVIEEENYFFKLSNYQKQIEELITSDRLKIFPETRKNEILNFIRQGLEDFSISRSQERARHWGVPVPGDESQVMYVWFDALSNYITALDYTDDGDLFHEFWLGHTDRVHVIGKGILRFHAVYWPAMLLSAGLPLPTQIAVHGYITVGGEKMSKSLGNALHPQTLVDEYGAEAVRYYFLREMPSGADGDYSPERMEERFAELANHLGNLVSRVAAMADKYFSGTLDHPAMNFSADQQALDEAIKNYDPKRYLDAVFAVVARANDLTDKQAPFKMVKTDPDRARQILSELSVMIAWVGQALLPALPQTGAEIIRRYGGDAILVGDALFPRRDQK